MRPAKTGWGELASHMCPVSCEQMQAHLCHPDKGGSAKEFQDLNSAYQQALEYAEERTTRQKA